MSVDEPLRRRALERLGSSAGVAALAAAALESATLVLEPPETSWEGSLGHVDGHAVTLHVDEARGAALRASPAAWDALLASVAAALAERPGASLVRLVLAPPRRAPPLAPYR